MESFSQRQGINKIKIMQIDSIDDDLRNSLWTALTLHYWHKINPSTEFSLYDRSTKSGTFTRYSSSEVERVITSLIFKLWMNYFKLPVDSIPKNGYLILDKIKSFFFKFKWYEVYDFIEFIYNNYPDKSVNQKFAEFCNSFLKTEMSAYRFIEGKIAPITSEVEIQEIEEALSDDMLDSVASHLKTALELLSDKQSPDYRNSIKESISAVESMCIRIVGREKAATLGKALNLIEKKGLLPINSNFKTAIEKLYAYTNSEYGIRHALLEESNVNFEDAKFMLVSCSALVNYLKQKALSEV